jgi:arsenate reductase
MSIKIYGIPNCGTCQKALKWLDARDVTYQFINTKENRPSKEMIREHSTCAISNYAEM